MLTQVLCNPPVEGVLQAEPDRQDGQNCQEEDKQRPVPGTQLEGSGESWVRHGQLARGSSMAAAGVWHEA